MIELCRIVHATSYVSHSHSKQAILGTVRAKQFQTTRYKRGCVFSMVIWPAFRMKQHRVKDHRYHAPQFNGELNFNMQLWLGTLKATLSESGDIFTENFDLIGAWQLMQDAELKLSTSRRYGLDVMEQENLLCFVPWTLDHSFYPKGFHFFMSNRPGIYKLPGDLYSTILLPERYTRDVLVKLIPFKVIGDDTPTRISFGCFGR